MKPKRLAIALAALTVATLAAAPLGARADDAALAPREEPAKSIPVPTDVSPGMQKLIAAPLNPLWHDLWKTGEEWRKAADKRDPEIVPTIPAMAERLHVKIEPSKIDGVKVFIVTPDEVPAQNRNRLLIHIHGGCYVLFPGEAGATEAITMAGLEHFKVISVDYRVPPEAYFPAAIDDVLTVYKALQRTTDPEEHGDLRHLGWRGADVGSDSAGKGTRCGIARSHFSRHADVRRDQDR
jgi:epsilon-lactone hydrolase